jgi:hypothetical protein
VVVLRTPWQFSLVLALDLTCRGGQANRPVFKFGRLVGAEPLLAPQAATRARGFGLVLRDSASAPPF